LLIETLRQEIFAPFGAITTLDEFSDALADELGVHDKGISALVLAGARERAEELVCNVENSEDHADLQHWTRKQRDLLARDINEVCAAYHAAEAKTVKSMKLDSIWEPSPFPVEVSAAHRKSRTAEPFFAPDPWPPGPPGLLVDMPQEPGEV